MLSLSWKLTKCKINEKNKITFIECEPKNLLFPNGTCKNYPLGCQICFLKSENEIGCNQCDNYLYEKGISNYTCK